MTNSFSIGEAIRFGWHTVKSHSALVFQVVLTLLALQVAGSVVQRVLEDTALGTLASIVLTVVGVFVGAGSMLIALRLARGEHTEYRHIWPDWRLVWRYFASGILAGLVAFIPVLVGLVVAIAAFWKNFADLSVYQQSHSDSETFAYLLHTHLGAIDGGVVIMVLAAICAFYLVLRYSMSRFEVLDGARIVDSLRKSAKITRGVKWKLLGFCIVLGLLNLLGAILLLVGLLVTIPISMIAMAHVYTKLRAHAHAA